MSNDARHWAQAFLDLYNEIDGVADELSSRDYRIVQEFYPKSEEAKSVLDVYQEADRLAAIRAIVEAMGDPTDPKHLQPQAASLLVQIREVLDD